MVYVGILIIKKDLPDGNIEDVTADGGRDRHVAETLPGHDHGGDEVGYGGAGGEESEAHHLGRDVHRLAHHVGPPHHQVGVRRDPDDTPQERYGEELLTWNHRICRFIKIKFMW